MSRWDDVEAFVTVASTGSFTAAAARLDASPSFVSRAVRRLESRLGSSLLYRTTRQTSLTDAGRTYYEHCRPLIDGLESAERSIEALRDTPTGLINLTCATHFGERYIAPAINDFLRHHPRVSVNLHLTNEVVDVVREGYDLAIRLGVLHDSELVARRLASRRLYVCASPGYLDRHGAPQTLAELPGHNCLTGSTDYWTFRNGDRREERRIHGNLRCNSGPALLDAVAKGMGLAQLPDYYVHGHLQQGTLVSVLDSFRFDDAGVWAVFPRSRHPAPKLRALVDWLVEAFAERPPWAGPPQ